MKMQCRGKPNECNQCDYASYYASALKTHLKMHSGEKSNKCNQCDYASSQAGNLRNHLKTHSGEKSNKYGVCEKGFRRNDEMMKHKKKQHLGVDVVAKPLKTENAIFQQVKIKSSSALVKLENENHGSKTGEKEGRKVENLTYPPRDQSTAVSVRYLGVILCRKRGVFRRKK